MISGLNTVHVVVKVNTSFLFGKYDGQHSVGFFVDHSSMHVKFNTVPL